ncbi:MAG: FAD-dependent oxidoreductase [Candidatus Helarchaeota archaeon]|nr:FAD-dependent oxidoreductase [Candidatus Helarchaeota archaeon]
MEEEEYDVIIIGAGPAGLTAGIYAIRANLKTIIFSGKSPPRITLANNIENYPGFIEPISGNELLDRMQKQTEALGATIRDEDVISAYLDADEKMVSTKNKVYKSKVVIIATGMGPRRKTLVGEENFVGRGLSYCATCDGPLYRGKKVILMGNDKETGEEALELLGMGVDVSIYTNGKNFEVEESLIKRIKERGIKIDEDSKLKEVFGTQSVKGIILENDDKIESDGVFIVYTMPSSMLLQSSGLKLTEDNRLDVNSQMETNIKGVYAAGDVVCEVKQISTAVGTGATAAQNAIKYIRALK